MVGTARGSCFSAETKSHGSGGPNEESVDPHLQSAKATWWVDGRRMWSPPVRPSEHMEIKAESKRKDDTK